MSLTYSTTRDAEPVFSPDGNKILFRSARDTDFGTNLSELYTMNADGFDQLRLTHDDKPESDYSWSRDSAQIVFVRDYNKIWRMNHDGSNQTLVVSLENSARFPIFTPDNQTIVYNFDNSIWRVNVDGTNNARIVEYVDNYDKAVLSPNGAKVVYGKDGDIRQINLDGTNETVLISQPNYSLSEPQFSPNGAKILLRCYYSISGAGICTANANGSDLRTISPHENSSYYSAVWSPDNAKIAFIANEYSVERGLSPKEARPRFDKWRAQRENDLRAQKPAQAPAQNGTIKKNGATEKNGGSSPDLYKLWIVNADGSSPNPILSGNYEAFRDLSWQPSCGGDAPIVGDNLISWWRGENNADDSIGNNNGGSYGNTNYAAGKIGQAFDFNGGNDFIVIPDSDSLDVQANNYTVAGWVKLDSAREHYLFGKGGCFGDTASNFYVGVNSNFDPFIDISHETGGSRVNTDGATLSANQWHHIALRKNGTAFTLFVDGAEAFSHQETEAIGTNDAPFTIGAGNICDAPQLSTDAKIDEVQLFGRALSDSEIIALSSGGNQQCVAPTAPAVEVHINFPHPVAGGRATNGEIVLRDAVPAGGATINLASSNTSVFTVPATVVVPENSRQASFPITTTISPQQRADAERILPVAAPSVFRSAEVAATFGGETARATVTVAPSAPDLAVSNFVAPATVNIREDFTASWTITNHGEAASPAYRQDTVYLSPDAELGNGNDTTVDYFYDNDAAIQPGAMRNAVSAEINITEQRGFRRRRLLPFRLCRQQR